MSAFACTGAVEQCLSCPLDDCRRDVRKPDHCVDMIVPKRKKAEPMGKTVRQEEKRSEPGDRKEYYAAYYRKNRDRILARIKARAAGGTS